MYPSNINMTSFDDISEPFMNQNLWEWKYIFNMTFDEPIKNESKLILEWIGASSIEISFDWENKETLIIPPAITYSSYREFIIDFNQYFEEDFKWEINISFYRDDISTEFIMPRIFQPEEVIFEKE